MNNANRIPNSGTDRYRHDFSIRGPAVLELLPSIGPKSRTKVQSKTRGSKPRTKWPISRNGFKEYNLDSKVRGWIYSFKREITMIYDSWLDKLFDRNSEESLKERAKQSRLIHHDDEDITDRTQKKLKATHISLGFTLDKVIEDLRKHGHG